MLMQFTYTTHTHLPLTSSATFAAKLKGTYDLYGEDTLKSTSEGACTFNCCQEPHHTQPARQWTHALCCYGTAQRHSLCLCAHVSTCQQEEAATPLMLSRARHQCSAGSLAQQTRTRHSTVRSSSVTDSAHRCQQQHKQNCADHASCLWLLLC